MSSTKELWGAGGELDAAGARVGGEKRQYRDFQPPDYDPRQRRRTDDSAFATQQVDLRHYLWRRCLVGVSASVHMGCRC
jgi:hypothetical protein